MLATTKKRRTTLAPILLLATSSSLFLLSSLLMIGLTPSSSSTSSLLVEAYYKPRHDVRRGRGGPGGQYTTIHGESIEIDDEELPCHDDAERICIPHKGAKLAEHISISRYMRCMLDKLHLFPAPCQKWVKSHEQCLVDVEEFCPSMTMGPMLECLEKNYDRISLPCRQSAWFRHQFPPAHARQSLPRGGGHHAYADDDGDENDDVDPYFGQEGRRGKKKNRRGGGGEYVLPHDPDDGTAGYGGGYTFEDGLEEEDVGFDYGEPDL